MKQNQYIITGIDFSPCSLNAIEYASALCVSLNVSLVVVHAYHTVSKAGALASIERHIKKTLREEVSRALNPVRDRYPDLRIEEEVRHADPMEAILWAYRKYHSGLVVVGTQGAHESPDIFIGSTTGSLIKLGDAPVLAIPRNSNFVPYQRVVFAVKHPFVASRQVLEPFLMLVERYHPTIDLLHVTRDSTPDLSRFPNPYAIAPHTHTIHTSDSDNIYHSVEAFLKEYEADLLVVISRLRGFFEGLFAQSSTSTSLFNSELPVLVLHGGVRD